MNDVLYSSKNMNWGTPQELFNELNNEFNFTLDPCATEINAKCALYYTVEMDGLSHSWKGHTVFCNPPYGRKISDWVKKSYEESRHKNTIVVMLIPARTDTRYFHEYILDKAEIRFIKGRLKFTDDQGKVKQSAPFPSMIVVYNRNSLLRKGKDNVRNNSRSCPRQQICHVEQSAI